MSPKIKISENWWSKFKTFEQLLQDELEKEKAKGNQVDTFDHDELDEKKRRENQQFILIFGEKFVQDAVSKKHRFVCGLEIIICVTLNKPKATNIKVFVIWTILQKDALEMWRKLEFVRL